jgi:hypothetical protein
MGSNQISLECFILAAKSATYAAQGDGASVEPLLADTKQLEYTDGSFLYRDIYAGMFRFVGQEVVYQHRRAVWSMSYAGGLLPDANRDLTQSIYAHLRKALLLAPASLPLRGPALHEEDGLRYTCAISGSMDWFHGAERILHNESLVYELRFSGGSLA